MSQGYIGKTCPYCQFSLKADSEVVECCACKVPHHRECWAENGGCTTFGCREKSYQPVAVEDRPEISFDEPSGRVSAPARGGSINKLLVAALVTTLFVLVLVVFAYINLLSDRAVVADDPNAAVSPGSAADPAFITDLDADYYIDYENGTIPLGDLPIGARVVDPSWEWEYRLGVNYSDEIENDPTPPGEVKPVTWLFVSKDHYDGLETHVTLLAAELIGNFAFDDSTDRDHEYAEYGYNHWGESGTGNADHGLRPWLNSTGIHSGEGFYQAFSESFKSAVLTTNLPNKEWQNGSEYSTQDKVFIPSTTELGDTEHDWTYKIGNVYTFFSSGAGDEERVAMMVGDGWSEIVEKLPEEFREKWVYGNKWFYWTRSPGSINGNIVRFVPSVGAFSNGTSASFHYNGDGVRPALNLKSGILVSEINP